MSAEDWAVELVATPEVLWRFVEQPEPTTNGDAFLVSMRDLQALGYSHIEIHFPTRDLATLFSPDKPDAVTFHKVAEEPDPADPDTWTSLAQHQYEEDMIQAMREEEDNE